MDTQRNQIVSRKKTFWKMVKTIFIPAQTIANLMVGCGGKRGKGKRRLSLKNMHHAKDAFIRASLRRPNYRANDREINSLRLEENKTQSRSDDNNIAINAPPSVPLNIDEAQVLLETLTLSANELPNLGSFSGEISRGNNETDRHEQLVAVDVETVRHDSVSEASSSSDDIGTGGYGRGESVSESVRIESTTAHTDVTSHDSSVSTVVNLNDQVVMRRNRTSISSDGDFHGWRRSSIEVTPNPPVTLAFLPSGLCVGDRIVWVKDEWPEIGTVRWIGKIRNQFYAGIEFDKPIGNSSGIYGYGVGLYKRLFTCELSYGRFVPVKELVLYKDYHDTGIKSGIVCVICRDDFLETWEPDFYLQNNGIDAHDGLSSLSNNNQVLQPSNMVSSKCGHLYHFGCLDHWFSTKKRCDYHCPFCLQPMERNEVIRIFPTQI